MNDLVEALRQWSRDYSTDEDCEIFASAADEIERLREQLASARKALDITKKMIAGEMIEHAIIDTQTGETLGGMVDAALTDDLRSEK